MVLERTILSGPEAIAQVSAKGEIFETTEQTRDGVTNRVFVNAPKTMAEYFQGARNVETDFIVYGEERWTFAQVMVQADALGAALVERYCIKPGDRVGIAMRNLPEWVVSYAAILSIGAIVVSLNAWWTPEELAYAIGDAELSVLICDAPRAKRTRTACERGGVAIVLVRGESRDLFAGCEHWGDVVVAGETMPAVSLHEDMDATILYTSGTTGRPKGAVSTHGAISQAVMAFSSSAVIYSLRREAVEGEAAPMCFILGIPLFHVTGCIPVMLSCFTWHYKLVMMHHWDPEAALKLIEQERVTYFVGVPTQAWDMVETDDFADYDTSSMVNVAGGGAAAPPALVGRVEAGFRHAMPTLGYGLTETNAYGPSNYGYDYELHPTSTGLARTIITDIEIRASGRVCDVDESGEIWFKSPALARGYWRDEEASAARFQGGWLRTGDVGRIDIEGFLYVEDRENDMIIRGGENVYCAEVEAALYEMDQVREAAVFAVPHERLGEEVGCAVVLKPGAELSAVEIRAFLGGCLANYKIPTRVAFTSEPLERTATGKYLKRTMAVKYFEAALN